MIRKGMSAGVLLTLFCCAGLWGADSPNFGGTNRDNHFQETGLLKKWPPSGPKLDWSVQGLGKGYSSVAVVGEMLYVTGLVNGKGILFAYSTAGKLKWQADYGKEWTRSYPGARTTPTVSAGRVYLMTAYGRVVCLDAKTGKQKWCVDTKKEFGAAVIGWGITESLLVFDQQVICTPGGSKATVVSLNKRTGAKLWQTKIGGNSAYCSPTLIKPGGKPLILTMISGAIIGLDTKGKLLWREANSNKYEVHPNTPLYDKKTRLIYFTSGYGHGGGALKLAKNLQSVKKVWFRKELDCHHGGVVLVDGFIYGLSSNGQWICIELKTGKIQFKERGAIRKGAVIYADGMIYAYDEKGMVGLIKPTPKGLKIISKFKITKGNGENWAHPVIAAGRLFIRHGDVLLAYKLKK